VCSSDLAAALELEGGTIAEARIALGGVAPKPWRDREAEERLRGRLPTDEVFREAADHILRDARGLSDNAFKIELARRAVVRALRQAAGMEPR
jgi:xanthine dehydrogenase YagS FAD-binding subunit